MSRTSRLRLAFSTLACPEWDAATVVERAAAGAWDGVEWRGGPEGTVRASWPARRRSILRRSMDDAGLASIAVTTYTDLISPDPAVSRASVDEAAAHAELAAALGAPVIRVFLGERSDAADRATLTARAIDGLRALLERLGGTSVAVAIEPHDEHVAAKTIRPILEAIRDPRLGVVWDLGNACSIGEAPEVGLAAYAGRIAYVQVKDGTGSGPSWRLGDLGAGDVPLERAIHSLTASCAAAGTDVPPISLEWERAWHDELAPAEVALPRAHAWLVEHLTPLAMPATMADAVDDR